MIVLLSGPANAEETRLYQAENKRDPFVSLVAMTTKVALGGILGVESIDEIKVEGVVMDTNPSQSIVIANGSVLKTGEEIGNVKVLAIRPEGAEFAVNGIQEFKALYQGEYKEAK